MSRMILAALCGTLLIAPALAQSPATQTQTAVGTVFHDANRNGVLDADEAGLPEVGVSNGRQVVTTDADGRYELPVDDDDILFVIKPADWMTPTDANHLPRFYYIHKPAGSPTDLAAQGVEPTGPLPEAVNFALYPQDEPDQFRVVVFGDPQAHDLMEVRYITHDVVEELVGVDAAFGMTLGDIASDNLSVLPAINRAVAAIGLPWYNIHGNHDINIDATTNPASDETFERIYGPTTYAFNFGPAHFVVLDDILASHVDGKRHYDGGFTQEQIAFLRDDLARVPQDQLVVVSMHIPLDYTENASDLVELLNGRPNVLVLAAHTHRQEHRFLGSEVGWEGEKPLHHFVQGTVCGPWWAGSFDERGIPHATMSDGTPNGYAFLNIDGSDYTIDYKAASRPASQQMTLHTPRRPGLNGYAGQPLYVNFYIGAAGDTVEARYDGEGEWIPLHRVEEADPAYVEAREMDRSLNAVPWRRLPGASISTHLWRTTLPESFTQGTHAVEVRATDMFGRTHTASRVLLCDSDIPELYEKAQGDFDFDPERSLMLSPHDFSGGNPASYYDYDCEKRLATWIYGARSGVGQMKASFDLDEQAAGKPHQLVLSAQDDDREEKCHIRISLNGTTLFEGPNPFVRNGWSRHTLDVPADVLQTERNTLLIENLENTANAYGAPFFMLNYAVLQPAPSVPGD